MSQSEREIFKKLQYFVAICHIQNHLTKTGRKIRKLFAGMNGKRIKYIGKSNCHVTESHIVKKPEKETVNTLAAVGAREEIILKN